MKLALLNGCIMNVDSMFNAEQLVALVNELWENEIGRQRVAVTIRLNVDIETEVHPYLKTGNG